MIGVARLLTAGAAFVGAIAAPASAQSSEQSIDSLGNGPASFERVGEVLVNAMLCQPFGYSLDHDGLVAWTEGQVSALADQTDGYDRNDARLRLNRAATDHYWFVRDRYELAFELGNQTGYFSPQRFRLQYRKKCADLDSSSDVGAYFAKRGEEPRKLELLDQVGSIMLSDATVRRFARAYPPYLAETLGRR
jgi:hypothetical protein